MEIEIFKIVYDLKTESFDYRIQTDDKANNIIKTKFSDLLKYIYYFANIILNLRFDIIKDKKL
jgi:hypothetical protein